MTTPQRIMLFRLFNQAAPKMKRAADDDLRHEITEAALGEPKSWTKLNNKDVDKLKTHLQVIINPDSLDARLAANNTDNKECERLVVGIEQFLTGGIHVAFDPAYVEKVSLNKYDTRNWRGLSLRQLRELHLTIKSRASKFHTHHECVK